MNTKTFEQNMILHPLSSVILLIDGLDEILSNATQKQSDELINNLTSIARLGRSSRIHLAVTTKSIAKLQQHSFLVNVNQKILMDVKNSTFLEKSDFMEAEHLIEDFDIRMLGINGALLQELRPLNLKFPSDLVLSLLNGKKINLSQHSSIWNLIPIGVFGQSNDKLYTWNIGGSRNKDKHLFETNPSTVLLIEYGENEETKNDLIASIKNHVLSHNDKIFLTAIEKHHDIDDLIDKSNKLKSLMYDRNKFMVENELTYFKM